MSDVTTGMIFTPHLITLMKATKVSFGCGKYLHQSELAS
jgi:hypothetical protein